jgi:hypothetical protein
MGDAILVVETWSLERATVAASSSSARPSREQRIEVRERLLVRRSRKLPDEIAVRRVGQAPAERRLHPGVRHRRYPQVDAPLAARSGELLEHRLFGLVHLPCPHSGGDVQDPSNRHDTFIDATVRTIRRRSISGSDLEEHRHDAGRSPLLAVVRIDQRSQVGP